MYRLSENIRSTHGPDGGVVLNLVTGEMLRLNQTGSLIFAGLRQGEPETQIVQEIVSEFSISEDLAYSDFHEFMETLRTLELLQPSES